MIPRLPPDNLILVIIDNYDQTGDVYDEENDIHFRYDAKNKKFIICRVMPSAAGCGYRRFYPWY